MRRQFAVPAGDAQINVGAAGHALAGSGIHGDDHALRRAVVVNAFQARTQRAFARQALGRLLVTLDEIGDDHRAGSGRRAEADQQADFAALGNGHGRRGILGDDDAGGALVIDLLHFAEDEARLLETRHGLLLRQTAQIGQREFFGTAADFEDRRFVGAEFDARLRPLANDGAAGKRRILFLDAGFDAHALQRLHGFDDRAAFQQRDRTGGIGEENFITDEGRAADDAQQHQQQCRSKGSAHDVCLR